MTTWRRLSLRGRLNVLVGHQLLAAAPACLAPATAALAVVDKSCADMPSSAMHRRWFITIKRTTGQQPTAPVPQLRRRTPQSWMTLNGKP